MVVNRVVWCYIVLRCVMLCVVVCFCAVLCYFISCGAVLYGFEGVVWCHVCCVVCVMLSYAVLCDASVLCCAISYHVVLV